MSKTEDALKEAFEAMKKLGVLPENIDQKSAKIIKDTANKFDDSFYTELEKTIKDEIKATAGIFAAIVPQSKIISGIKNALGEQVAQGDSYCDLMKDIFNRTFLNSLRRL